MKKGNLLYEGKAKRLYETDDPSTLLLEYKDSLTAFNALKKAELSGKGELNNSISAHIFSRLAAGGVPNHFVKTVDNLHQVVRNVTIIPLEVVVRNITTGSLCKRLGVDEGVHLSPPLVEFYLKDDDLGDPIVTEDHVKAFSWAGENEISFMKQTAMKTNDILKDIFSPLGIVLVDFKLEFGRTDSGEVILADEVSPDTCRFWDFTSGERLDKDRFRKDLGDVLGAYREIWKRLSEGSKTV
ncbi:MAG: phosphoribosylaminoimidazolesuccinocarboxamide synthase [Synergistota bacterium]|nr:phosphoribosylaminoimidazolesuccinocarboxamide synthase [Synergistota bacterium]